MNEILNMGFFDITNNIPIDLCSYGKEGKNKEIKSSMHYISKNIDKFKDNIIVTDRAYFSYSYINFLETNNLKYIIRVKGNGNNLKKKYSISKNNINYNDIIKIKDKIRLITYNDIMNKTIYMTNKKKYNKKYKLQIKNDCVIVTNLLDTEKYNDKHLLELYRSRWDIEVFFKHIKRNFKFQHLPEKDINKHKKMYICELIIIYISKIIEKYYWERYKKQKKSGYTYKINRTLLVNSLYDSFLYNLVINGVDNGELDKFCKLYIRVSQNKKNKTFPRTSKTPFSKWYVKGYSNHTKYTKILNAIYNDTIDELNKNLKTLMSKFVSINDTPINKVLKIIK
jgi:hypothetical protein